MRWSKASYANCMYSSPPACYTGDQGTRCPPIDFVGFCGLAHHKTRQLCRLPSLYRTPPAPALPNRNHSNFSKVGVYSGCSSIAVVNVRLVREGRTSRRPTSRSSRAPCRPPVPRARRPRPSPRPPAGGWGCAPRGGRCIHWFARGWPMDRTAWRRESGNVGERPRHRDADAQPARATGLRRAIPSGWPGWVA